MLMTFGPGGAGAVGMDGPLTASLCQNEVVASQTQETVHGQDYPYRNGYVETRLPIARGE
jgi:hypothetical protein